MVANGGLVIIASAFESASSIPNSFPFTRLTTTRLSFAREPQIVSSFFVTKILGQICSHNSFVTSILARFIIDIALNLIFTIAILAIDLSISYPYNLLVFKIISSTFIFSPKQSHK